MALGDEVSEGLEVGTEVGTIVGEDVGDELGVVSRMQVPQAKRQLLEPFVPSIPVFLHRVDFFWIQSQPLSLPLSSYFQVLLLVHEHVSQAS